MSVAVRLAMAVAYLAVLFAPQAEANDVVWLKNGDRVTGEIRVLDGDKLVVQTNYMGEVSIAWPQVRTVATAGEVLVGQKGVLRNYAGRFIARADGIGLTVVQRNVTQDLALNDVRRLMKPSPQFHDWEWKTRIDIAADYRLASNRTQTFGLQLETRLRHDLWRHQLRWEIQRKRQDNTTKSQFHEGQYAIDRFLTPRWFWQGRLAYRQDAVEEVSDTWSTATGIGYQFRDDQLGAFSLTGLASRTHLRSRRGPGEYLDTVGVGWEYNQFLFGRRLELFSHGEAYVPVRPGSVRYLLNAEAGIRLGINNWTSIYVKASRHATIGGRGAVRETRYMMGLGVNW